MSGAPANRLEAWFAGQPDIVQSTLHAPFTWMNDTLKSVSGDPQALMAAAPRYLAIAAAVTDLAEEQRADRDTLAPLWRGEAYEAFSATVDLIDAQCRQLTEALGNVPELLENAADACAESANVIIDLVTSLVMFAISLLVTNLALAILTVGLSAAASVAAVLARAAQVASRVSAVVSKLSALLQRVGDTLARLSVILKRVRDSLQRLQQALTDAKKAYKAAGGREGLRLRAQFMAKNGAVTQAVALGTAGVVAPPTTGGAATDAAVDYGKGVYATEQARDAAGR